MLNNSPKPWPKNCWYQAAWANEIEPGKLLSRTMLNQPVVIYRDADGKAAVLEDRCCHRATPLRLGEVVPEGLQCGYHGMVFGADGACVKIPGQDTIPPQARVRSYPVVEKQEFIWVWMGDPALADESLILDYPYNDDYENWPHKHGMYEIDANYMLLIDNLMDLTHIPFIHRATIGGGGRQGQVDATIDVERTPRGLRYIRWMENIAPPPTYVKGAGWDDGVMVDRWQEFEFAAPGSVWQWSGALPVGSGAKENRAQDNGVHLRVYHGATPATETKTYYFWVPANGHRTDDPAACEQLYEDSAKTFYEDVAFLEAQQQCMLDDPDAPMIDIKHDIARRPARQAVEKMIRAELDGPSGGAIAAE